jgi:hypothetical protein
MDWNQATRDFWGTRLRRVDVSAMGQALPSDAREVLTQVGLPRGASTFEVAEGAELLKEVRSAGERYVKIGNDGRDDIGVHLATGAVWAIGTQPDTPSIFINSSLAAFLDCVRLAEEAQTRFADTVTDEAIAAVAHDLRAGILARDPPALKDPEGWWSEIVDGAEAMGTV